ncbi:hypothetical protein AgCh_000574 [Apium graveolens]
MSVGTNFANGIIDLGALQVAQITSLNGVWATYQGGPDNKGSTFYEPASVPDGFSMIGSYGQPNNQPLYGWVLVAKDVSLPVEPPGLALPTDYLLVYDSGNESFDQTTFGHIWLPVAPQGYSAVGFVVTSSADKPSLDKVRVVRSVLTEDVENDNWIWGSNGFDIYGSRPVDMGSTALVKECMPSSEEVLIFHLVGKEITSSFSFFLTMNLSHNLQVASFPFRVPDLNSGKVISESSSTSCRSAPMSDPLSADASRGFKPGEVDTDH